MRGSAAGDRLNSLASRGYQMNSDNQDNKSDFEIKDDDMEEVEKQILQTLEQLSTEESTANDDKILKSTDEEPQTSTEASTDKGSSREANESSDKGGMKTRFKNNFKKRPNQTPKQSVNSGEDARTNRSNFKQAFLHKKKQNQPFKQNQPSTSSKKVTKEASIGRKIGIVHALHPQIFLTNEQMSAIQQNILQAILDQPKNGTKPGFRGIARHKGWLGITCLDDPTVDWLRGHVTMWYQRTLKVVEEEAITKPRRKAHAYLPGCAVDPEAKIFMYLQKQNEGLRTENWTVLSRVDDNMLTRLILLVDETSAEELEKRREVNIKFGKGTIRVKSRKGEDDDGSKTEGSSDGKKNQPATSNGDNIGESADDLVEENSASSSSPKSKEGKKPLKKSKQRVKGNITPEKASKSADEEGDDAQKGE